ncbi:MAG TPA: hypothetical protein VF121_15270 [Thermoanaerobaculia bacterium]|nr:hypothetical protein [Thermoanaerobaculia bacterium]
MPEEPKSFWTSIPGMLTGAAALITAVGGLIYARPDAKPVDPVPPPRPPFNTEAPVVPAPINQQTVPAPVPSVIYTDGCVINGEAVVITASNLVLSRARNFTQVGVRVPPHPNCRFCLDDAQGGHYCVGPSGEVSSGGILVGNCWPCRAGAC